MKIKQHIKKILAIILFLNLILFSLLPVCRLSLANSDISNIPESEKNGKTANMYLYTTNKINGLWRFTKKMNGSLETNLYCAQKEAHVSTWKGYKADGYNWIQNVPVFKDEESYKKITWIKNNFWEYIGQDEQDKYTMEEKFKILNSQNSAITEEDVQNVYSNENEIFRVYQMIVWKYTKAYGNDWTDEDLEKIVSASKESTRKIYYTIVEMANKYYDSYDKTPSIEVNQTETITEVTNGECRWGVEINNTSILPYTMELTVNGQNYTNYTYENNVITIKGLDNNASYVFNVYAKSAYVKCEGEIWFAEQDDRQNMIEITGGNKFEIGDSLSTNLDVKPEGEFKVIINKKDTENNPLDGVTFDIAGECTKQVITAKTDDNSEAIATIDEKAIEKADQVYTYTIKEISSKDNMYIKIKEPVTINLVSGIEKDSVTGKFYYCIREAKFENGSTEKDVLLENGKTLRASLTRNTESKDASFLTTVSLNLQNEKKNYDLALTKTIVNLSNGEEQNNIQRLKTIDTKQLNKTTEDTTAKYYLNKKPLEVKKSSIIEYRISVYNEGDIDAKNIEITDYIPDELQICDENGNTELSAENTITINEKYVWEVSTVNGKTVAKTKIEDTIQAWDRNNLKTLSVSICCKIKDETQSGELVYNVAEISSAEDTEGTKKINEGDDRDSKPDTLAKDNTIVDYKNRYIEKKNNIEDETNIDKSKYNYQDDDDFEVIKVVNRILDLSLRKSITKIGTDSANMTEVVYGEEYINRDIYESLEIQEINRLPYLTINSTMYSAYENSGHYYHKKEAVTANKGDFVEYSIRIYNEGQIIDDNIQDYAGYAKEITDYLPEGLEFYALVNNDGTTWKTEESNYETNESIYDKNRSFGSYKAEYNKEENTVKIVYKPGNIALQPSNYLMNIYAHKAAGMKDIGYYNPNLYTQNATEEVEPEENYMYQEIKFICKIKEDANDNAILTNLAEITDYAAVEKLEDGTLEEQEEVEDKDSSPNIKITNGTTNLKNKEVNLNTYYEDKSVDDTYIDFYAGVEDDDDFENILVQPDINEFKFVLNKVDEQGKPLIGADFRVERFKDNNNEVLLDNEEVKGTYEVLESNVKYNNTYTYKVVEVESAPEYVNVMEGKYITIKTYMNKDKDLVLGVYKEPEVTGVTVEDGYYAKYGFTINNQDGSLVTESQTDLYEKIKVAVKNDTEPSQVTITIPNKPEDKEFDLALRKFITGVRTNVGTNEETTREIESRTPVFKVDENGNYIYNHDKEPVLVANQNIVEYTIRVYNEGTINGYAKEIKDDIPAGLEFLPDDELNKTYRWLMLDEEGNETDDASKAKYITSDYLSKEQEKEEGANLIKAFDEEAYEAGKIKEPDYKEVKVAFKVTIPNTSDEIIINKAQISDDSDEGGKDITDKDSTPNEWNEGEDDQDIEKIKVQYFDLSLRKWVTKAIVIEDGKETVYETGHTAEDDPEEVVKVDLKKSKLDKVVVKFEYKIRVTNDLDKGQIAGSVEEISDYIPEGLKFVAADNPEWEEVDGKVVTDQLAGQILEPGESKEVTILLTWINRENNMGLKVNVAEISKDYNEYGSPDIDSIPNNKVPGEDDIDVAPVMLTVTTGETVMYIGITIAVLVILAGGVIGIKKFVIK